MQFDDVALVVVTVVSVFLIAWLLWGRYSPVRLAGSEGASANAGLGAVVSDDASSEKVGELVTALMHAKSGWRQLVSQPSLPGSIDGVFVRKCGRGNQFEVRVVQTRCSRDGDPKANYDARLMADTTLIEELERLRELSASERGVSEQALDAIIKAIRRGSVRVTKHVYAHMLGSGKTLVYAVGRDGHLIDRPARVTRISGVSHQLMLQALANGLARLNGVGASAADAGSAMREAKGLVAAST